MQEVEVRITSVCPPGGQGGIRAYASATIGGCFGVRGIKIVEGGRDGLFVSMPSRKTVDGYSEVCFPVTAEFREQLYGKVLGAYRQVMREVQTAAVQGYGIRNYLKDMLRRSRERSKEYQWNGWLKEENWIGWQGHVENLIKRLEELLEKEGDTIQFWNAGMQRAEKKQMMKLE